MVLEVLEFASSLQPTFVVFYFLGLALYHACKAFFVSGYFFANSLIREGLMTRMVITSVISYQLSI